MSETEYEDLDALVKSPGWVRFAEAMRLEWSEKFAQHIRTAVNETDDAQAASKMRQVIVAKDAVDRAMAWPAERMAKLIAQKQELRREPIMSRRGSL